MQLFASVSCFVICVVVCSSVVANDGDKDLAGLQRTWEVAEAIFNGAEKTDELKKGGYKIRVKGKTMQLPAGGGKTLDLAITLDTGKTPRAIDLVCVTEGPHKGETLFAIYDLDQDELQLCMPNKPREKRPTAFRADDASGLGSFRLKRMAPAKGGQAERSDAADARQTPAVWIIPWSRAFDRERSGPQTLEIHRTSTRLSRRHRDRLHWCSLQSLG